jgi:DNA mismatch repair protein MSH5
VKLEFQPTVILVSLRIDSEGGELGTLRDLRQASLVDEGRAAIPLLAQLTFATADDRLPLPYRLDYRPNLEFSYEGAKNKLGNLQSIFAGREGVKFLIPGEPLTYDDGQEHDDFESTSRQGKLLRISGWINLESKVSVGCVGAVLTFLQRKRNAEFLQDDPNAQQAYQIASMEMFSMEGTMYLFIIMI